MINLQIADQAKCGPDPVTNVHAGVFASIAVESVPRKDDILLLNGEYLTVWHILYQFGEYATPSETKTFIIVYRHIPS